MSGWIKLERARGRSRSPPIIADIYGGTGECAPLYTRCTMLHYVRVRIYGRMPGWIITDMCAYMGIYVTETRARVNGDVYVCACTSVNIHAPSVSDHVTGNVFLADSRRS